ncbi:MAG: hypothetical protein GWO20_01595, partial [Candidatus Korarchaeota archaeon]|nr:hypothetical protein [Candidatus Korarchaeota archaeon]NIU82205.1 hypothetical protein [Candidatus Thorarchaeota archaeon]
MNQELEVLDPQEQFQDFFKIEKYREKISQLAVEGETSLKVDFEDIVAFDQQLAQELIRNPDDYLKPARDAAYA